MCGIAGKLALRSESPPEACEIEAMLSTIRHRGPDEKGIYLDGPVGLGHARLSIIDLGTGAQPMCNEDQTVWIVFNGEIYNFQELRKDLEARGHSFRSCSDTEVIIHLYEQFGVDALDHLRGMFAFAIWDCKKQMLFLARDRVGIKPLYFYKTHSALYFASEMKAILALLNTTPDVSQSAVATFLAYGYLPGHETLFCGIEKLLPGHYLTAHGSTIVRKQYWDLRFTKDRYHLSLEEAADELHSLLGKTVADHMIADVPVGVLLSGGVDSSSLLDYAIKATPKKVRTFTVGFDGGQVVDERPYARLAAQKFGTEHHEITINSDDFWSFLPRYVWHMEEPVHEPPAVALYHVSKLAREHVKVLLSGEGGDEAFAGYPNYPNMLKADRLSRWAGPFAPALATAASLLGSVNKDHRWARYGTAIGRSLGSHYFSRTASPASFFLRNSHTFCSTNISAGLDHRTFGRNTSALLDPVRSEPLLNQMLYIDSKTWLPDDLLVKADKITMANSLELRVPFLDHKILEFAASLHPELKVKGDETKRILKKACSRVVPPEVLNRKKAGFPVPYNSWLRKELLSPIKDVLLSSNAESRGYFRRNSVENLLHANVESGRYGKEIFCLLALELWHQQFADNRTNTFASAQLTKAA